MLQEKKDYLGSPFFLWESASSVVAIRAAKVTIHETGVRNISYFSDKLVEDGRWQIR